MSDNQVVEILPISEIKVGEDRIRKKPGDIKGLAESLEGYGQVQPIMIKDDGTLVAGERRLMAVALLKSEDRAVKGLEPGHIKAIRESNLDPFHSLIFEFIENKHRKQFEKAEEAIAIMRLKTMLEEQSGSSMSNRQLAKEIGYSTGQVSMAHKVAEAVDAGDTDLLRESSIAGAYKKLQNKTKIKELLDRANASKETRDAVADFESRLFCGDALEFMSTFEDESFDLIHLDPPWGIGIDSYDRNHHYGSFDDSADTGITLAKKLIPESFRLLKDDTYIVVWFGIQYYQFLYDLLADAGFHVNPVPYIWHKPNKRGAQNDPTRTVMNVWEPFFVAAKGDPRMFAPAGINLLEHDMPKERVHFAQKSVPMLMEVLSRFSFGSMRVLDPTFGSGSFLVAAQNLGRSFYGSEKDADNYANAINALKMAKVMDT